MLGDWGSDVIKVERPKYGDLASAYFGSRTEPVPFNPVFCSLNRNKRSITLNTKNKGGIEAVYKLVEQMDVVINNFRPGVMDRMGLGYEKLKRKGALFRAPPSQTLFTSLWTEPETARYSFANVTRQKFIAKYAVARFIYCQLRGLCQRIYVFKTL